MIPSGKDRIPKGFQIRMRTENGMTGTGASIGRMIRAYRKKEGLTQSELAGRLRDFGIPISPKTISGWENDLIEPGARTLLCLCRLLHIPDCVEEYFGNNPENPLSGLNEDGKKLARSYIEQLLSPTCYAKVPRVLPLPKRLLRLFDVGVSAGTGNFLDSDSYEEIEVGDEVPKSADFGVRISGDSMEPRFVNHQTVFVHRQEVLSSGETGIFSLNGNAYCKVFRETPEGVFLISLNPKYAPIPVRGSDAFHIFGKVVG